MEVNDRRLSMVRWMVILKQTLATFLEENLGL